MDVYFSTVIRNSPPREGGELIWLDWETKQVKQRVPIYPTDPELDDPNPRGSTRGGRGVEWLGDRVLVASYHTLLFFDRELTPVNHITHPLMAGLHETFLKDGRVWVTSTTIDAALEIDLETGSAANSYWPREMAGFQEAFGLSPQPIDKATDQRQRFVAHSRRRAFTDEHHVHLNVVAAWKGEMYGLFSRLGAIVNLDRQEVVVQDLALRGGHNLLIGDDGTAIVNGTFSRTIRFYDLATGRLLRIIDLAELPWVQRLLRRYGPAYWMGRQAFRLRIGIRPNRPVFVRGLDRVGDLLFVGISPAAILCLDLASGKLLDVFAYASDVRACIHGVKVISE